MFPTLRKKYLLTVFFFKSKRDALLQTKVALQDVEEYDPNDSSKVKTIARQYVIPLPRSHEEGNEWCFR